MRDVFMDKIIQITSNWTEYTQYLVSYINCMRTSSCIFMCVYFWSNSAEFWAFSCDISIFRSISFILLCVLNTSKFVTITIKLHCLCMCVRLHFFCQHQLLLRFLIIYAIYFKIFKTMWICSLFGRRRKRTYRKGKQQQEQKNHNFIVQPQ